LDEERCNLEIRPFDASKAFKSKRSAQFLRYNHRNPEHKNENFILADAFFKAYQTHIITQNPDLRPFSMLMTNFSSGFYDLVFQEQRAESLMVVVSYIYVKTVTRLWTFFATLYE